VSAYTDAMKESARCRANVVRGGSVDFWIRRLEKWATELESAAYVLRGRISWLTRPPEARDFDSFEIDANGHGRFIVTWNLSDAYEYSCGTFRAAIQNREDGWHWYFEDMAECRNGGPFATPDAAVFALTHERGRIAQ
jgi:hypothetical protein